MADIRRVTADFSVAPQLTVTDVAVAATQGFRTLIANRPDREAPDQPMTADLEAAATAAGLNFRAIPVSGAPSREAVEATARAIADADGPILAFCRSGTRSVTLWALSMARTDAMTTPAILAAARAAGYDLSGQAHALDAIRR